MDVVIIDLDARDIDSSWRISSMLSDSFRQPNILLEDLVDRGDIEEKVWVRRRDGGVHLTFKPFEWIVRPVDDTPVHAVNVSHSIPKRSTHVLLKYAQNERHLALEYATRCATLSLFIF